MFSMSKNKKKILIFGLGEEYKKWESFLFKYFDIVGCSDNYRIPDDIVLSKLYIRPRDIPKNTTILITTQIHFHEICYQLTMKYKINPNDITNTSSLFKEFFLELQKNNHECIFVIGDSHSRFFCGGNRMLAHNINGIEFYLPSLVPFYPIHIGPVLAYSLNKYGTSSKGREKFDFLLGRLNQESFIPPGSILLCAFGEIDIRVHILKEAARQRISYEYVVDKVIDNYMDFVQELMKDYKIIIWGPVASQSDSVGIDPNFPRYGSERERNMVTRYFNLELRRVCTKIGVAFISVFSYLHDGQYMTRHEYYCDPVHLAPDAWRFAKDEFLKYGIVVDI